VFPDELERNEVELLGRIQRHVIDSKINSMISFLLEKYSSDGSLNQEACSMIHEEVKNSMALKI
jgi:hypothetical protein